MSFPRSNAPGRNAKRGRPGVCGHVTPPYMLPVRAACSCVVYAQRWPGLADGAGWCDGWHGLGWFVCAYMWPGWCVYMLPMCIRAVWGVCVAIVWPCVQCVCAVLVCGWCCCVPNVIRARVWCHCGCVGGCCCVPDNLTIRSNNTKTNRKTNRNTDSQIVKNAGFLRCW